MIWTSVWQTFKKTGFRQILVHIQLPPDPKVLRDFRHKPSSAAVPFTESESQGWQTNLARFF